MNEIITYKSKDGKEFLNKQECIDYENFYLTENQLIECFKFFYEIPEDSGNLEYAEYPSDATKYFFKFNRTQDYQKIELYYNFKSKGFGLCEKSTLKGFKIMKNLDFAVLYEEYHNRGSSVQYWQTEKTYNIKEFYKHFENIRINTL
jgi:hypothetical protein